MIEDLRVFLWVVETGTLTAAARKAHVSQPAVTVAVQRLEGAMGGRLFDRGPSGATLTAAGQALFPWAEQAVAAVGRGQQAVAAIEGLDLGEVHLGAGSTATAVYLPPLLKRFMQQHAGLHLTVRERMDDALRAGVASGALDLAIVADEGTEPWVDDALVLVGAPGTDEKQPFLSLPVGSHHRKVLDAHFPGVTIAMELSSLSAVRAHVEAGLGQALLSQASVARALAQGRLVVIDGQPVPRTLYLLHAGLGRLSPAASALRAVLHEVRAQTDGPLGPGAR